MAGEARVWKECPWDHHRTTGQVVVSRMHDDPQYIRPEDFTAEQIAGMDERDKPIPCPTCAAHYADMARAWEEGRVAGSTMQHGSEYGSYMHIDNPYTQGGA